MPTDQSPHYLIIQVCQGDMVVVVVGGGGQGMKYVWTIPPLRWKPYFVSYSIS